MKSRLWSAVVFCLVVMPMAAANSMQPGDGRIPERYIVTFRDSVTDVDAAARDLAERYDGTVLTVWKTALHGAYMRLSETDAKRLAKDGRVAGVEQDSLMESSGFQGTGKCSDLSGTPPTGSNWPPTQGDMLWHLTQISNRDFASDIEASAPATTCGTKQQYQDPFTGSGIPVYVIDGGIAKERKDTNDAWRNHEDFVGAEVATTIDGVSPNQPAQNPKGLIDPNRTFPFAEDLPGDHNPVGRACDGLSLEEAAHGTAVAGFVVGNKTGVAKGATLVPVKVVGCFEGKTYGSVGTMISGFEWVALHAHPPAVVSFSKLRIIHTDNALIKTADLIGRQELDALEKAIKAVLKKGIPVVVSANNQHKDACLTAPAYLGRRGGWGGPDSENAPHVISVGGVDWTGSIWQRNSRDGVGSDLRDVGSNFGQCVDIWAPAARLVTVAPTGTYRTGFLTSGTSYAAPMVAGVIARMMEEDRAAFSDENYANVQRVWDRLAANATILANRPGGESSPNLLLYLAGVTFKKQLEYSWSGSTLTLTTEIVGPTTGAVYKWYRDGQEMTGVPSSPTISFIPPSTPATSKYSVIVERGGYSGESNRIELPNTGSPSVLKVAQQPTTFWKTPDSTGSPSLTAAFTPSASLQWYKFINDMTPSALAGETGNTLTPDVVESTHTTYTLQAQCANCFPNPAQTDRAQIRQCMQAKEPVFKPHDPTYDAFHASDPLLSGPDKAPYGPLSLDSPETAVLWFFEGRPIERSDHYFERGDFIIPSKRGIYTAIAANECSQTPARFEFTDVCFHGLTALKITVGDGQTATVYTKPIGKKWESRQVHEATVARGQHVRLEADWGWLPARHSATVTWSGAGTANTNDVAGMSTLDVENISQTSIYTVTITDNESLCTRTATFTINVIDPLNCPVPEAFVILAGLCQVTPDNPLYTLRQNGPITITPILQATDGSGRALPLDECFTYKWTWKENGNGADKEATTPTLPFRMGSANTNIKLTVTSVLNPSYTDTVNIRTELYGTPCTSDAVCFPHSCRRHSIRHSGVAKTLVLFEPGETLPLEVPIENVSAQSFEWHAVDNAENDTIIGGGEAINVTPVEDTKYWVLSKYADHEDMSEELFSVKNDGSVLLDISPRAQTIQGGGEARLDLTINDPSDSDYPHVNYDHYIIEWYLGDVEQNPNAPLIGNQRSLLYRPADTTTFTCRVKRRSNGAVVGISDVATVIVTCSSGIYGGTYAWPDSNVSKTDRPWVQALGQGKLLRYEWLEQKAGQSTAQPVGAGAMIQVAPSAPYTDYTAIATDACGQTATLPSVRINVCKPTIDSTSPNSNVQGNVPFTLNVAATAAVAGEHVTVNWYKASDPYHAIALDTQSLTTTIDHSGAETYYAVADGNCGVPVAGVRSRDIVITACLPPVIGSVAPTLHITNSWENATLWVQAGGDALTYQWYEGLKGDTSKPIWQATNSSHSVHPAVTTKYWCRITSRNLCISDSENITVEVCSAPTITTPPAGSNVFSGGSAPMSVAAVVPNGSPALTYQWLRADANGVFANITGANGVSYTTPALTAATTYRVDVSSGVCVTSSEPVTIAICANTPIVPGMAGINVPYNGSTTLRLPNPIALASPKAVTWYRGEPGVKTQFVSGPDPSDSINIGSITESRKYWAEVTVEPGCTSRTGAYEVNVCVPTITAHPQGSTINSGASAPLSVAANGGALTYQWYRGQSGDTSSPLIGFTTPSINVNPAADTSYWVRVTGSCTTARDSNAATVHICVPPAISTQTGNVTLAYAQLNYTLYVQAGGDDLTYQWYNGLAGNTSSPIQNATQSSLAVNGGITADYWVKVSGRCGAMSSNTIKLSVPPIIDASPAGGEVTKGTTKLLTVAARGNQLSYQWFDGAGNAINGANGASWTTPPINNDVAYWVRVKSGEAPADSTQAVLTVCQPRTPVIITNNQVSGSAVTLRVDTVVTGETYEWYRGESGVTSSPAGSGYQLTLQQYGTTRYWVRTKRASCDADSVAITVTTCVPAITTQPSGGAMINSGQTRTMTVAATGTGTLTYQWYSGDSGVATNPINGATGNSYTTPALSATTKYWVQVKSAPDAACGANISANSNTATVTVCQLPQITQHPYDNTLVSTSSGITLGVTATGTGLSYQWYEGSTGVTTIPVPNSNSATVTVYPGVTKSYWARVNGTCGSQDSNAALQSVPPTITTQPVGASVTKGTTKMLSVAASGTQLAYQWYSGASTIINGATSNTFTTPAIHTDISYWVKVKSGTASTDSTAAALTVCQPRTPYVVTNNYTSGSQVTLRVDPAGGESYDWYRGESGVTTSWAGSGYLLAVIQDGTTKYWVRTHRTDCDADSDAITVTTCYPLITTQPQGAVIESGATKQLSVEAKGTGPLTYQWYTGTSGSTANPISNATGATYTTPALTSTTSYWVQVKSPSSGVCPYTWTNSAAATVTVCAGPSISYHPQNTTIDRWQSITLSVTATGQGLQYQWYEGAKGVTTTPIGTNSASVPVTPGTTKSYWVRITGTCGTADSNAALVSVRPQIISQPSHMTVCQNSTQHFEVGVIGSPLTYKWEKIVGSTTTTVGTTAAIDLQITQETTLFCTVTSGNASVQSWPATISVTPSPTIYNIGKQSYAGGAYVLLTAAVAYEDQPYVSYAWYAGPIGNTTTLLSNGNELYTATSPARTVWVRVTHGETGCASDMSAAIP